MDVGIADPARPQLQQSLKVLVDTGATLSVVPRRILNELGVEPIGTNNFRGFGGVITRETGIIQMSYDGQTAGVTVVFGEEDDPAIMGVTALESLGYHIDPVTGKLSRTEMLLLPISLST